MLPNPPRLHADDCDPTISDSYLYVVIACYLDININVVSVSSKLSIQSTTASSTLYIYI